MGLTNLIHSNFTTFEYLSVFTETDIFHHEVINSINQSQYSWDQNLFYNDRGRGYLIDYGYSVELINLQDLTLYEERRFIIDNKIESLGYTGVVYNSQNLYNCEQQLPCFSLPFFDIQNESSYTIYEDENLALEEI